MALLQEEYTGYGCDFYCNFCSPQFAKHLKGMIEAAGWIYVRDGKKLKLVKEKGKEKKGGKGSGKKAKEGNKEKGEKGSGKKVKEVRDKDKEKRAKEGNEGIRRDKDKGKKAKEVWCSHLHTD